MFMDLQVTTLSTYVNLLLHYPQSPMLVRVRQDT